MTLLMRFCVVVAGVGGLGFGYDLGVIVGGLPEIVREFKLNGLEEGIVVAGASVGQILGAVVGGYVSDRLGRKVVMTSQCVSLIVGSCLIASAMSFLQLIIGRIVIGSSFSFSMLSNVAWISEIVPPEKRGSAVSTYELCVTIGVLLAFIVNILTSSWRFAFLGVVPIALVQIVSLRFVPESPVWHMIKGDHGASHQVIANLGGTSAHLDHIRRVAGEHVQTQPFLETLKKWKIPFYVVTAVQGLGLLTGGINIRIFAERIFESVGITNSTADVLALLLGVTKVAVTIVAVFLMDKCGRRVFYMSGISLLVLANSLIALGAAMPGCFNSEGCDEDTVCSGIEIQRCPALCGHCSHYAAVLVVTGCVVGYAAYQISFGPLNFVIGSEMFPPHSRGRFLGIQVIIQGCFQLVTTLLFSAARYKITLSATVLFHTLFCIVGLMFITFFTVETRGKDPESILSYLKVKWA